LPVHAQDKGERAPVEVEGGAATARRDDLPQILHVEDDESLTAIVREAMSRNAVVTSARSIAAARQQLAEKRFDAIILDITLPEGSGLDLLPIAMRDGERPPVTISYTADEPSRALRSAVDAALVKSRHSVTQLMVTVLARIEAAEHDETQTRQVISRP
jgi:DNA-binding response OmpR family regulator